MSRTNIWVFSVLFPKTIFQYNCVSRSFWCKRIFRSKKVRKKLEKIPKIISTSFRRVSYYLDDSIFISKCAKKFFDNSAKTMSSWLCIVCMYINTLFNRGLSYGCLFRYFLFIYRDVYFGRAVRYYIRSLLFSFSFSFCILVLRDIQDIVFALDSLLSFYLYWSLHSRYKGKINGVNMVVYIAAVCVVLFLLYLHTWLEFHYLLLDPLQKACHHKFSFVHYTYCAGNKNSKMKQTTKKRWKKERWK